MSRSRNRSNGIIDKAPPDVKETVDQMLMTGCTYRQIVDYLADNNITLSQQSVCRYARKFAASVEMLRAAQDNMAAITSIMDEYPDLDITEALSRLASQDILQAIVDVPAKGWSCIPPDKLLKQATALVRAVQYKRRVDHSIADDTSKALDANKTALFDVLSKRAPALYRQVVSAIEDAKKEGT